MSGPPSTPLLRGLGLGLGLAAVIVAALVGIDRGPWVVLGAAAAGVLTVAFALGRRPAPAMTSIGDDGTAVWAELHRELARARRHERPLSIARLPGGATARSAASLTTGPRRTLRRVDRAWSEGSDLVILMPESDRAAAERAVERLATTLHIDAALARVATFPGDGLTTMALVAAIGLDADGQAPRSLVPAASEPSVAAPDRAAHG